VLLGTVVLALCAADVALARLFLRDGLFRGRPLPPFGALNHPRQRAWLAAELAAIDGPRKPRGTGLFDPELGWAPAAGARSPDGRETSNSAGARGQREYAPVAPEGVVRLLCAGDSFTYGSEVADGETWEAQLEALSPRFEALNFGVGGYGTDQALLRLRRELGRWSPQVAVMGILVENIGRNVNRYRPLYFPSSSTPGVKPRFVLAGGELVLVPQPFAERAEVARAVADGSVIARLAEHEYWREPDPGWLRHSLLARLFLGWRAYSRRQAESLWAEPEGEPAQVTLALLSAFQREALASGVPYCLVLVFPRQKELDQLVERGSKSWQTLLDGLAVRGVPCIDLADELAPAYAARRKGFFVRGHLSPRANGLVAARVARWLGEHVPP
jgi:hypothetical protein